MLGQLFGTRGLAEGYFPFYTPLPEDQWMEYPALLAVVAGVRALTGSLGPMLDAWLALVLHGIVVLAVSLGVLALLRAPELKPALQKLGRLARR